MEVKGRYLGQELRSGLWGVSHAAGRWGVCHSEPGSRYHGLWAALLIALWSHRQEGPFQKEPDSSLVCLDYVRIICCPENEERTFLLLAFSRLGLCSPGLRYVNQAGLQYRQSPASAFWGLGLKVCTITLGRGPKPSYINSCVGQCREEVGGGVEWGPGTFLSEAQIINWLWLST